MFYYFFRPLYLNNNEVLFTINIRNISNKNIFFKLNTEPIGKDRKKLRIINIIPNNKCLKFKNQEKVLIKCLPLETGIINSYFIELIAEKNFLISIECSIEPLKIFFYFPLLSDNDFIKFCWSTYDFMFDSFKKVIFKIFYDLNRKFNYVNLILKLYFFVYRGTILKIHCMN